MQLHMLLGTGVLKKKKKNSYLDPQDDAMIEMRRLCLERRQEKDLVKRETLSIALHRARQKMRRKQAILRCKEATQLGAPSRLKGQPPQTRAPILEPLMKKGGWRKWNICKDALTLFTNTSMNSSLIHRTQKYQSGSSSDGR